MKIKTGIILGSGLNTFTRELSNQKIVFSDKSGFHKIKISSGLISGKEVVVFSGRRHFYEGYSQEQILENIKLAKDLGIELLIITNAAGGLNKNFKVSDLMIITSHLNLINLLIPVKSNLSFYNKEYTDAILSAAMNKKILLKTGSYCCTSGPMYESKSEINFLNSMNIDAVGMSTIPEMIYANDIGIKTVALSCITNVLSDASAGITTHEEVIEAGKNSYNNFSELIKIIINLNLNKSE